MKIYFAGSIRGGRQDVNVYRQLITLLQEYGCVLTEHVGNRDRTDEHLGDQVIYERDMAWMEEADLVVAEVTVPSHGVGYEIARAEALGKPILCLHRRCTRYPVSALMAGNPYIQCKAYSHLGEAAAIVEGFVQGQSNWEKDCDQEQEGAP